MHRHIRSTLLITLTLCLCLVSRTHAQPRNLLAGAYSREQLADLLTPVEQFHPYPTWSDRAAWNALDDSLRAGLIREGEEALDFDWPNLPASVFLEFKRNGNRSNYERIHFQRRGVLQDLAFAECAEGKGRFLDQITNGIWAICEETYWGVPAHVGLQKAGSGLPDIEEPTVDLFAAETGAQLAWVYYLLGEKLDEVSPLIRPRIRREIDRRITTVNLEREDFWWMGLGRRQSVNNWNPWIVSNWLTAVLLTEQDNDRRAASVYKTMRVLDAFLNQYPEDGGCDEGPGYWNVAGGRMFNALELYHKATDGKVAIFEHPLIAEIGRYIMRVHIHDRYAVNFADASARSTPSANLVYQYGKRIGDERMMAYASWLAHQSSRWGRGGRRAVFAHFDGIDPKSVPPVEPLIRDVWLPDTQIMIARSKEGSAEGFFLAAKGGHNAESHNHNDVGSFVVYLDGLPALIDLGVETYTRETFSSERYTIWTMRSDYHNLPTINGVEQKNGREFAARDLAYESNDDAASFTLDIAGAYPKEARVRSWRRAFHLDRDADLSITDAYDLERAESVTLNLMTPYQVIAAQPGELLVKGTPEGYDEEVTFTLRYDSRKLSPEIEPLPVEDRRLGRVWGDSVTRIRLRSTRPGKQGTLHLTLSR